jgi:hypothetical protein
MASGYYGNYYNLILEERTPTPKNKAMKLRITTAIQSGEPLASIAFCIPYQKPKPPTTMQAIATKKPFTLIALFSKRKAYHVG